MAIEVKVSKVEVGGKRLLRVDRVRALTRDKLPGEYVEGRRVVYMEGDSLVLRADFLSADRVLRPGDILGSEGLSWWMKNLRDCGDRLHVINAAIRRERTPWKGVLRIEV